MGSETSSRHAFRPKRTHGSLWKSLFSGMCQGLGIVCVDFLRRVTGN